MTRIIAATLLVFVVGLAQAAPINYTYRIEQATGILAGSAFGPSTLTFRVQSDSTSVTPTTLPDGAGICAPGTSATLSIDAGTAFAITDALRVCTLMTGTYAGLYKGSSYISHFDGTLSGLNLVSNQGPLLFSGDFVHDINTPLSTASGTLILNNRSYSSPASSLTAAFVSAAAPASIPTLSEWGLIAMSSILAMFGIARIRRRRS